MEYMNLLQSIWTIVVFVIFVSVILWAWSNRRIKEYDEIANIVLDVDAPKQI